MTKVLLVRIDTVLMLDDTSPVSLPAIRPEWLSEKLPSFAFRDAVMRFYFVHDILQKENGPKHVAQFIDGASQRQKEEWEHFISIARPNDELWIVRATRDDGLVFQHGFAIVRGGVPIVEKIFLYAN